MKHHYIPANRQKIIIINNYQKQEKAEPLLTLPLNKLIML